MTKATFKDKQEIHKCASCQKPDTETILMEISLPKYIKRDIYCPDCISVLIDDSKKSGKGKPAQ
jgi:hypothetical protein